MQTGAYFGIGTTHLVCEDYALKGNGYVIISDGCSNAGGPRIDTDWGSRILTKSAEEYLLQMIDAASVGDEIEDKPYSIIKEIIHTAEIQCRSFLTLDTTCLIATLGMAYAFQNNIQILLAGDGVVGGKKRDGTYEFYVVEFVPGGESGHPAPFYPFYLLNPLDFQAYIKKFGGRFTITQYNGDFTELRAKQFLAVEYLMTTTSAFLFTRQFPIADFEYVFIGSDGWSQFYRPVKTETSKHNEDVEIIDVLEKLLAFPDYSPGFAERQCQWMFKQNRPNTFPRLDWHNRDDVSLGVIYCGD